MQDTVHGFRPFEEELLFLPCGLGLVVLASIGFDNQLNLADPDPPVSPKCIDKPRVQLAYIFVLFVCVSEVVPESVVV